MAPPDPLPDRRRAGALVAAMLLAPFLLATGAGASRLAVCVLSLHSPDEADVFRTRLPAERFDLIDLSPRTITSAPWLPGLCRDDLRCDVVVFSSEFAGRFFGRSGASLGLQEMEETACRAHCAGLFHHPREVFLLACNTLATKDEDRRTPAEYLQVLLDHDFDRASAERVVALRYGPLGPSFREALRRIFMGVPRIYGFASVAPLGDRTAPLLEKYFRSKGDYGRYLERVDRSPVSNKELLAAFAGTGLVQVAGLTASDPAAADREQICTLYDETQSVARRLGVVEGLMRRPDLLAFLPAIQVFVDRHPLEGVSAEDRGLYEAIQRNDGAREQVLRLVRDLNVSALQLELAHLARDLDWMTGPELHRLAVDGTRQLLGRPLTSEVVDVVCEVTKHESIGAEFTADDLSAQAFQHPEGMRLIDCLSPKDERVSTRLLPGLEADDVAARLWAAFALSRRLPLPDSVLVTLAHHLADPSPDLRERLQWVFKAQRPLSDEVRDAVRTRDARLADELRGRR